MKTILFLVLLVGCSKTVAPQEPMPAQAAPAPVVTAATCGMEETPAPKPVAKPVWERESCR